MQHPYDNFSPLKLAASAEKFLKLPVPSFFKLSCFGFSTLNFMQYWQICIFHIFIKNHIIHCLWNRIHSLLQCILGNICAIPRNCLKTYQKVAILQFTHLLAIVLSAEKTIIKVSFVYVCKHRFIKHSLLISNLYKPALCKGCSVKIKSQFSHLSLCLSLNAC